MTAWPHSTSWPQSSLPISPAAPGYEDAATGSEHDAFLLLRLGIPPLATILTEADIRFAFSIIPSEVASTHCEPVVMPYEPVV
jgi:hypothetical protein